MNNGETPRLDEPDVLHDVLDRLDELVLKPVDGAGGKGIVTGPPPDDATLRAVPRARGCATPPCAVPLPHARRWPGGAPAHRPTAVRRQRRYGRVAAARRTDPG